jgi:hypothetical protein
MLFSKAIWIGHADSLNDDFEGPALVSTQLKNPIYKQNNLSASYYLFPDSFASDLSGRQRHLGADSSR